MAYGQGKSDIWEGQVDYKAIDFPSNRLTVADIRRVVGSERGELRVASWDSVVADAVMLEQYYAQEAFDRARGRPDPESWGEPFEHKVEMLADAYAQLGLARGVRDTTEKLRRIEAQAASQVPPGRRRSGGREM